MKIVLNKSQVNEKYLHLYQKKYIPPKYSIYFGGSGSGKSFSVEDALVYKCLQYATFDIIILRKVGNTLTNTVRLPLETILKKRYKLIEGVDYEFNKSELRYDFKTGSRIRLMGYDDPEKVKGIEGVNVIVLEELTDFTQDDLVDIVDRARTKPPKDHPWKDIKVIGMFNPINESHWVRSYFFAEEKDASDDVHMYFPRPEWGNDLFVLKTTWRDNKWYNGKYKDPKEREREKKLNPRKYSVYCNGNFGVMGKLVFEHNVLFEDFTREELLAMRREGRGYGLDFGYGDPDAFLDAIMDTNGDIWLYRELGGSELRTSELANLIQVFYPDYSFMPIFADNQAKTLIEDMKNDHGFTNMEGCEKGAGSVLSGIEWLNDRYIHVNRKLTPMAAGELESYEYEKDKKTGKYKSIPKDENNHFMDALRYLSNQWRKKKKGIDQKAWDTM